MAFQMITVVRDTGMGEIEALHTAARRHCTDRTSEWNRRYAQLVAEGRARTTIRAGDWEYTDAAYDAISRCNVLRAIFVEVERFVPRDFNSLEEGRAILSLAAETAQNAFTKSETRKTAVRAIEEERSQFATFIRSLTEDQLRCVPPLPFRRVLGDGEHNELHKLFTDKWGKWYGGCVAPERSRPDTMTLHVVAMERSDGCASLRKIFADHHIRRLLELREFDEGHELDLDVAEFAYNGAEGFWTERQMEWMVYASHEASVTFGGAWLVSAVKSSFPEFERYRYRGWDLKEYDLSA